jgi:hypothetical protein
MSHGDALIAFGDWLGESDWIADYLEFELEFDEFFDELTQRSFSECLERLDESRTQTLNTVLLESFLALDDAGEILKDFRQSGHVELTQGQLAYLRAIWRSTPSIYEVLESVGGSHLILKDMIRGGEPIQVRERSASQTLAQWDLLLTRVITVKGVTQISGGTLTVPRERWPLLSSEIERQVKALTRELPARNREDAQWLSGVREEVALDMNWYALAAWLASATPRDDERPKMVNKDHDEIELVSLAFPIKGDVADIIQAIEGSKDFAEFGPVAWSWVIDIKGESVLHGIIRIDGDRLLAECNSVNRGKRLTNRLLEILGANIGIPIKLETSLEEASKFTPERGPTLMETLEPEQREELAVQLREIMLARFKRTIEEVVPMLGGSPRELVRTKAGRAKVANWLKLLENSHAHAPKEFREMNFDFTALWKELGLLKMRT